MQPFPVVCSTLSATHLGQFVQQQYQLGPGTTCRLLRAAINHAYLVTDGANKYVFRVFSLNWRSHIEISEELRLLQLLHENGVPVSYALPAPDGNYIQEIPAPEGTRSGVLFSFAKGEKQLSYSEELHYKIGAIMAKMHKLTQNVQLQRVQYNPQVLLIDPFNLLQQYISIETEEMRFMKQVQGFLLQQYAKVDENTMRKGVIHLDIWFDNLNIYNNSEITIFDFDFCGNGWVLHDIAYYMLQVFNTEREEDQYLSKLNSFYEGYESITPIPEEEKQFLPIAAVSIYLFYLGIQCQRFENWTNTFLNETYLKRYINLLIKKLYSYHKLPEFQE